MDEPYNASKKFILGERNGYLVTITSQDEIIQVSKVFSVNGAYVGETRTTTDNIGTQFNNLIQIDNRTLYDYRGYYWITGPEVTEPVTVLWSPGEPNNGNSAGNEYELTLSRNQNYDLVKKDVEVKMCENDVSDNATTQDKDNALRKNCV